MAETGFDAAVSFDAATTFDSPGNFPALHIEALFGYGPGTVIGPWTDLTDYVQTGTTFRGRQYELDRFQTGTATLGLVATDRRFDPDWTAGPYYGQLLPMVQIRIYAIWVGVTYNLFRGYVTDWGQTIPAADRVFYTSITAADGFLLLEQLQLPSSAWSLIIQQDAPSLWYRLGETGTVRATDTSEHGNYGLYDNVTQGAQGLIPNDDDGAVDFGTDYDPADSRVTIQNPDLITGYPFTISCMFQAASDPDHLRVLFAGLQDAVDATPGFYAALDWTGGWTGLPDRLLFYIHDGTNYGFSYTDPIADNLPHHMAVVVASNEIKIYLDGTMKTDNGSSATTWMGSVPLGYTIGNFTDVYFGAYGARAIIDEVCVWNGRVLTDADIADQALAVKTGWDGEDTGARVSRFLDAINWPTALRSISAGVSILGPATWSAGSSALSVLEAWSDTEYGLFYMNGSGQLVWKSRHARYLDSTSTTSQATFGDTTSGEALKYVADGFELTRDEALIRNPVTASRNNGIAVTVKDQDLINTKYWYRNWSSPSTQDQKDSAVRDRATWLLARYKEQATRLKGLKLWPQTNPTGLWPQALGREIGDRITVKRTPLRTGNQISSAQWIESIAHDFSPGRWVTTFSGSPVEESVYMVLDSTPIGVLDTNLAGY